jgi:hypothetical protein
VRRKRSMSVGGHQMTRAEKLSLPQLYNQYFHIAYYIRVEAKIFLRLTKTSLVARPTVIQTLDLRLQTCLPAGRH